MHAVEQQKKKKLKAQNASTTSPPIASTATQDPNIIFAVDSGGKGKERFYCLAARDSESDYTSAACKLPCPKKVSDFPRAICCNRNMVSGDVCNHLDATQTLPYVLCLMDNSLAICS